MKTIYAIQHTQSVHHTNGMVGSWTDWDLTEAGVQQARRIGERLRQELAGQPFTLYSSDLKRAAQTAGQIAACTGAEIIFRPELRERNLGSACGKSVAWLREHMQGPEATIDDRLFPDAESRRDAWLRLRPFFDALAADETPISVVVSHGGLLCAFLAMFMGLEPESMNTVDLHGSAGGVSRLLVLDSGKRIVQRFSDMSWAQS